MANVFEKAEKFASTALVLLKRTVKLPQLFVNKYGLADFAGAAGDVVNIKRPPLLRATDKGWRSANAIEVSDLTQSKIQVRLDQFPYNAVHLSPEEATLDEVQYVRDIQGPQLDAMTVYYEDAIVGALRAAPYTLEVQFNPAAGDSTAALKKLSDPRRVASRAKKLFTDAKVPSTGRRYWLVGSGIAEAIRDHDKLLDVDTSGLPEAVREGVITKLSGFFVIEVDALDEEESYFVHDSALALANVAPVVPRGAVSGSSISAGGVSVTQVFDYDSAAAKDRSIVESFVGAVPVLDPEVDPATGLVVKVDGEVQMEFYRAARVVFGTAPVGESATWTLAITATAGTYVLTVDGEDSDEIAYNATTAEVKAALNAIEGVSGVRVTGTTSPKTIKFTEVVDLDVTASVTGGTVTVTAA